MKPVMYIFANRGLGMSPGKLAAQVAHAAVEAYRITAFPVNVTAEELTADANLIEAWYHQGHPKIVMLAEDTDQLHHIQDYLEQKPRGYRTHMVIDEGRTEISAFTPTALGVELVDKDDPNVLQHFGHFKTYREEKPAPVSDQKFWRGVRGRSRRA